MMLGHDDRPVRGRHDPSFGSFRSIEHFHFGRFHHPGVAAACVANFLQNPHFVKSAIVITGKSAGFPWHVHHRPTGEM
jgi:hypothetical protein